MNKKLGLMALGISFFLIGCGGSSAIESSTSTKLPENYSYKVVNNQGTSVAGKVSGYTIKIYSDNKELANPKDIHKGVAVKINGKTSEVIPIDIVYLNKNIVVALFNDKGEQVAVSEEVLVTDVPVVVVEITL